jgi:hypothetical protein
MHPPPHTRDKASEELMPRMKQLEEDERKAGQTLAEQIVRQSKSFFSTIFLFSSNTCNVGSG